MRSILTATAVLAIATTTAMAQQTTAPTTQPQKSPSVTAQTTSNAASEATTFANKVAAANAFEIQSSQMALEKSQNNDVKNFAQQMITDHTKAGQNFQTAAQSANVTPPPGDQTDAKHRATLTRLQSAQGAAFDKAYINAQMQAHREAVALFSSYAKTGRTPSLKTFARQTLPTLQDHDKKIHGLSKTGHLASAK
jgi:putative membrane protein